MCVPSRTRTSPGGARPASLARGGCCHRSEPHSAQHSARGLTRSGDTLLNRAPTILDYHSDCQTFALSISPLSTSSASSLKLAVGSYSEARAPSSTSTSTSSSTAANGGINGAPPQQQQGGNHFTVAAPSPAVADLDDASDSESETAYRSRSTRQRVSAGGSALSPIARAGLLYPPSAVRFAPARLSSSLASAQGDGTEREVLATSTECLRLWDLVGEQDDGSAARQSGGFVGQGQAHTRSKLVSRATLQNVRGSSLSSDACRRCGRC